MQKSLTLSHAAGKSMFIGKLPKDKAELRRQVEMLTRLYSRDGGVIHVCRPSKRRV